MVLPWTYSFMMARWLLDAQSLFEDRKQDRGWVVRAFLFLHLSLGERCLSKELTCKLTPLSSLA